MSKYIDAEKLIAEIEGQKKNLSNQDFGERCAIIAYDVVLSFIEYLQQVKPDADLEKASRHVYESWMGGTMDDVRRDMVELGKVLNARKEG